MLRFEVLIRNQLKFLVFTGHLYMGLELNCTLKLIKIINSFFSRDFNVLCGDIKIDLLKLDIIAKSHVDMMSN